MPKLTASKEEVKGLPPMNEGIVTVRLDGFKPALSRDKGSVNLNPDMRVINHAEYNDRPVFENLNTKGKWVWKDFCHSFGVPLVESGNGSVEFPGDFNCSAHGPSCDGSDPQNWVYVGPLLGQQAQLKLVQADNTKGGIANKVSFYVCKVPGCNERHSTNLAK
jgi:hypothetical protein